MQQPIVIETILLQMENPRQSIFLLEPLLPQVVVEEELDLILPVQVDLVEEIMEIIVLQMVVQEILHQ